ncbi:hypothetical protein L593_12520 [Salinarchaeum sp. Harcht-Bsk1]|uniref:DUF7260 family protein n=1 Tax=Salinarchaeum sp. Harcht-Bsk1 TaxID=1333523 RepID=UPI0003422D21|nr:hypothetical protein [Salinarchaeum sp. Harcht-Bsk1]AGN02443.1 hypothetical protein L593_12520 [Salinarchaeum sp. Harcht-Bsk1]
MSQVGGSRHAIDPPTIESTCSGIACEANSMLTVLVVLGALTLGTVAFLSCVRRARSAVSFERERLLDEYEAFLAFADRVANIPVAPRPDGGRPMGPLVSKAPEDSGLVQVRDAYRDTVMDVPHFDTDYDESMKEHMSTELSPELASAVVEGSQFTPAIRNPLVASAKSAAHDRRVLADQLDDERSDLEDAEDRLTDLSQRFEVTGGEGLVDRTFPDLQARWDRLNGLQDDCSAMLARRQAQLRDRTPSSGTRLQSPTAVSDYLYADLDVDFPVLSAGTRLMERIEEEKRQTVEALTERRR